MFAEDSRTENYLTGRGAKWVYTNKVTVGDLVPGWDLQNAGRAQAIVESAVEEYTNRTKAGSVAPSPVLLTTDTGFEVLDGVQRITMANRLNATSFSAYVVTTDSRKMATLIRIMINKMLGGAPETSEWTRAQAIEHLIIQGGMSVEEVAEEGGWSKAVVQDELTCQSWAFAVRCIGGPEKMHKYVLKSCAGSGRLADLQIAPEPIAAFFNNLTACNFTNGHTEPYIQEFFAVKQKPKAGLHKEYTKNLETFLGDPEVDTRLNGRTPHRLPGEVELGRVLKTAETVTGKLLKKKQPIGYMDEYYQIWNRVDKNLKSLAKIKMARTGK